MKAVKIAFRGVIGGENLKILKFFIFWFFDFLDRFYTFTCAPDLFTARGSGHRSRSTHFVFRFKVATILSDFPLTRGKAGHRVAARILARSQAISDRKFCGREIFSENFRSESRRFRMQLHTPRHADAWQGRCGRL